MLPPIVNESSLQKPLTIRKEKEDVMERCFGEKKKNRYVARIIGWAFLTLVLAALVIPSLARGEEVDLPVLQPEYPTKQGGIRNQVTFDQIHNIVGPSNDGKGLAIDLEDSSLYGEIFTGPYPFEAGEADFDYARYRKHTSLAEGMGTLNIEYLFRDGHNANDWPDGLNPFSTKNIGYRLDLWRMGSDGSPDHLGFYDSVAGFIEEGDSFSPNLTIVEGPFVSMVRSDAPRSLIIAWETDKPSMGSVYVYGKMRGTQVGTFSDPDMGTLHRVEVSGLKPGKNYTYVVQSESEGNQVATSEWYTFKTAPRPRSKRTVRFAFAGDSREGVGGGERNYMGSNFYVLNRIAMGAFRHRADFFIFGGDLVNGYTSDPADFKLQLKGFKQAMAGFWRGHPVYPGMGNHETLLNVFDDGSKYGISLDKWPYETESAEAVFAREFVNPENGPDPSDPRRPSYRENVYTFTYGPVQIISFNNNYWWTTNSQVPNYGGSPEGYIMEDQLEWIEKTLREASRNSKVKYVFLYAQEPVFPCGGHIDDAMWWLGDNNVRAYTRQGDQVIPEAMGIIEVRNRFWKAVSRCKKVAAVLTADEHEYHRTLISNSTPVGVFPQDDTDGDGVLDQYSADPEFRYPTWHITVGTGGAPYYSREETPWSPEVLSSQHGYALVAASQGKVSLTFYSITGQVIDRVNNLMAVK